MQVQALVAVGAVPVAHEEVALGHLAQVVLVQELAVLALLAEPPQPVLADERVEPARGGLRVGRGVALGAAGAVGAVARLEGAADGAVGREADLVGLAEEKREAEVVDGAGVVEDGRGRRGGRDGSHGGRWACGRRLRADAHGRVCVLFFSAWLDRVDVAGEEFVGWPQKIGKTRRGRGREGASLFAKEVVPGARQWRGVVVAAVGLFSNPGKCCGVDLDLHQPAALPFLSTTSPGDLLASILNSALSYGGATAQIWKFPFINFSPA